METKICSKCKTEKDVSEFNKNKKRKDGLQSQCRKCCKQYHKDNRERLLIDQKRYEALPEIKKRNKVYRKQYYKDNREQLSINRKRYKALPEIKKRNKVYNKQYHKNNKIKGNEKSRQYYKDNRERLLIDKKRYQALPEIKKRNKIYNKQYYFDNKIVLQQYANKRCKIRCKTDPMFRLNCRIGSAISGSLKGAKKGRHWEDLVGYTLSQLKFHLEKQFDDNMTWENYGKWHIDHKIPKSVFNFTKFTHIDFKKCWALNNLQPMWAYNNNVKNNRLEYPFQPSLPI